MADLRDGLVILGPGGNRIDRPDDLAVPHVWTFQGLLQTAFRTYFRGEHDEAIRHSRENALAMQQDVFIQGIVNERVRGVIKKKWHLEVDYEQDRYQVMARDMVTAAVKRTPHLRRLLRYCYRSQLWYGRGGSQVRWKWDDLPKAGGGKQRSLIVDVHEPVNGDKINHLWDGTPTVAIYGAEDDVLGPRAETIYDNLSKSLILKGPWRERFLVGYYDPEDADYYDPGAAERIHGVGLRDRLYWAWWLRNEFLAQVINGIQRFGLGVVIVYYDEGNPESQDEAVRIAKNFGNRTVVTVPRPKTGTGPHAVEVVESPVRGAETLLKLQEAVEKYTERYIIGQSASSKSDSGGLGTHDTTLQADTKNEVLELDAEDFGETLTGSDRAPHLVSVIKRYTCPWADFPVRWVWDDEQVSDEGKMEAVSKAVSIGVTFIEDEVRSLTGMSKPADGDKVIGGQQQGPPGADGMGGEGEEELWNPFGDPGGNGNGQAPEKEPEAAEARFGRSPDRYGGFDPNQPRDGERKWTNQGRSRKKDAPAAKKPAAAKSKAPKECDCDLTARQKAVQAMAIAKGLKPRDPSATSQDLANWKAELVESGDDPEAVEIATCAALSVGIDPTKSDDLYSLDEYMAAVLEEVGIDPDEYAAAFRDDESDRVDYGLDPGGEEYQQTRAVVADALRALKAGMLTADQAASLARDVPRLKLPDLLAIKKEFAAGAKDQMAARVVAWMLGRETSKKNLFHYDREDDPEESGENISDWLPWPGSRSGGGPAGDMDVEGEANLFDYAKAYRIAQRWNQQAPDEAELHEVGEWLAQTDWCIRQSAGRWEVVHGDDHECPELFSRGSPVRFAKWAERAPKGGVWANGKWYRGGQFTPAGASTQGSLQKVGAASKVNVKGGQLITPKAKGVSHLSAKAKKQLAGLQAGTQTTLDSAAAAEVLEHLGVDASSWGDPATLSPDMLGKLALGALGKSSGAKPGETHNAKAWLGHLQDAAKIPFEATDAHKAHTAKELWKHLSAAEVDWLAGQMGLSLKKATKKGKVAAIVDQLAALMKAAPAPPAPTSVAPPAPTPAITPPVSAPPVDVDAIPGLSISGKAYLKEIQAGKLTAKDLMAAFPAHNIDKLAGFLGLPGAGLKKTAEAIEAALKGGGAGAPLPPAPVAPAPAPPLDVDALPLGIGHKAALKNIQNGIWDADALSHAYGLAGLDMMGSALGIPPAGDLLETAKAIVAAVKGSGTTPSAPAPVPAPPITSPVNLDAIAGLGGITNGKSNLKDVQTGKKTAADLTYLYTDASINKMADLLGVSHGASVEETAKAIEAKVKGGSPAPSASTPAPSGKIDLDALAAKGLDQGQIDALKSIAAGGDTNILAHMFGSNLLKNMGAALGMDVDALWDDDLSPWAAMKAFAKEIGKKLQPPAPAPSPVAMTYKELEKNYGPVVEPLHGTGNAVIHTSKDSDLGKALKAMGVPPSTNNQFYVHSGILPQIADLLKQHASAPAPAPVTPGPVDVASLPGLSKLKIHDLKSVQSGAMTAASLINNWSANDLTDMAEAMGLYDLVTQASAMTISASKQALADGIVAHLNGSPPAPPPTPAPVTPPLAPTTPATPPSESVAKLKEAYPDLTSVYTSSMGGKEKIAVKVAKDSEAGKALAALGAVWSNSKQQYGIDTDKADQVAQALEAAGHSPATWPKEADLAGLKVKKTLGGSTGAQLVEFGGKQFVKKSGAHAEHVQTEHAVDSAYQALGLAVPKGKLFAGPDGKPVKLAEFVEGQVLGEYLKTASAADKAKVTEELKKGFVADALLGNWDVIGLNADNVLIGKDGKVWRIDNGGSLDYRAQGGKKTAAQWNGDSVPELVSMRDAKMNPSAAKIFAGITDDEIRQQVGHILKNKTAFLATVPAAQKDVVSKRIDWLAKHYAPPLAGLTFGSGGKLHSTTVAKKLKGTSPPQANGYKHDPSEAGHVAFKPLADTDKREGFSSSGAPKSFKDHAKKMQAATPKEAIADAKKFTGSNYAQLNEQMQKCPETLDCLSTSNEKWAAGIDKAIAAQGVLDTPITVWRGFSVPDPKTFWDFAEAAASLGTVIGIPGVKSCRTAAAGFADHSNIQLEIRARTGIYAQPFSQHSHEQEWMMGHNAQFKVVGVKEVPWGGGTKKVVQLEEVLP